MNKRNVEFMMSSCQKENATGHSEGRILLHSKTEYKRLIENTSILIDENEEYYFINNSSFYILHSSFSPSPAARNPGNPVNPLSLFSVGSAASWKSLRFA
jgi:hypothetical protein